MNEREKLIKQLKELLGHEKLYDPDAEILADFIIESPTHPISELVPLDENSVYAEITNKSRPPYMEWERVLARRICSKFGTKQLRNVKWPEKKEISNKPELGREDGWNVWRKEGWNACHDAFTKVIEEAKNGN